jgi:GntR family transcriptional regulator
MTIDRIDRTSRLPLYQQLYDILHHKITSGELQPGDSIPTENRLITNYGISRSPVRQALDMLATEGLIYRQQGSGTFVAQPPLSQGTVRITSFTENLAQHGVGSRTRVLFAGLVPATGHIARALEVDPKEELVCLERLRLANDDPVIIEKSHLVRRCCPDILDLDHEKASLRQTLERRYGIYLVRARQSIRAIPADAETATKLDIKPNGALLFVERIAYAKDDRPVEFLQIYIRSDRYILTNELKG